METGLGQDIVNYILKQAKKAIRRGEVAQVTDDGKCSKCGWENDKAANFCGSCGRTFLTAEQISAGEVNI
ncbi:MAG: zinc ribbon domain-containing protein [Candidatus Pacebacteria bacterium]|nr:zinc ribbon domain-containing protein [Candidatus Paceibacterota bacterium]